ncbi:uncharacterized protein EV422DRAFT_595226 [Fimicolochytrium jonesii]|uniref:uncharacterized protein n=1 Tax=Fimicolochytrium jonesii TaxID=1396493 RepID=UPI0022FEA1AD|nr:uncharacterized protein EV422DRAFT_595226 [Fimicolochytrium jonesii]KAI8821026.1 hypothetical protein EV422DRAFT_595226 [Fimicolochytrium jonesii]
MLGIAPVVTKGCFTNGLKMEDGKDVPPVKWADVDKCSKAVFAASFRHVSRTNDQSEESIQKHLRTFGAFVLHWNAQGSTRSGTDGAPLTPPVPEILNDKPVCRDTSVLQRDEVGHLVIMAGALMGVLPKVGKVHKWLPTYGCAIVGVPLDMNPQDERVSLCGLDSWEFAMSRGQTGSSGSFKISSAPRTAAHLDLGVHSKSDLNETLAIFGVLLDKAQRKTAEKRSAASGNQGHQRTPAFIHAVFRQAVQAARAAKPEEVSSSQYVSFGGMTEVGLHTRGQPRDTAWPLLLRVAEFFLGDDALLEKSLVNFKLFLLELSLQLRPAQYAQDDIDEVFAMIDDISRAALKFDSAGYDISRITGRVVAARNALDGIVQGICSKESAAYRVTDISASQARWPELPFIPGAFQETCPGERALSLFRQQAVNNSGWIPVPPVATSDRIEEVLLWLQSRRKEAVAVNRPDILLLALAVANSVFYDIATKLNNPASDLIGSVKKVSELTDLYSSLYKEWMDNRSGKAKHLMMATQRSKRLLATWIAYCVVHKTNAMKYQLMQGYTTPLEWTALSVLVLDDADASQAAREVGQYIRKVNSSHGKPLFSLQDQAGTFDFAEKYAQSDINIKTRWEKEVADASHRADVWWDEVQAKKKEVAKLRACLPEYEQAVQASLSDEKRARDKYDIEPRGTFRNYLHNEWQRARTRTSNARGSLSSFEKRIENAKKSPPYVVNPLPREFPLASVPMFFFDMPPELDVMSRLGTDAQELLHSSFRMNKPGGPTWVEHYNAHSQAGNVAHRHFLHYAVGLTIPTSYGSTNVDYIHSSNDGMWHPSSYVDQVGLESQLNAWSLNIEVARKLYTEKVPEAFGCFQWMVDHPAVTKETTRGNAVFSALSDLPKTFHVSSPMNKLEYLALASSRSFPHRQFRTLLSPLQDGKLVAAHPAALYQLGTFCDDAKRVDKLDLEWHLDIKNDGAQSMRAVLAEWASQLREKPRDHKSIPLLGVEKFKPDSIQVLRLKAKACLFDGYGVALYSPFTIITDRDAAVLCKLTVLFNYGLAYGKDDLEITSDEDAGNKGPLAGNGSVSDHELKDEITKLQVVVSHVMGYQTRDILKTLKRNSQALTDAMRGVVEHTPLHLDWRPYVSNSGEATFCFEATANDEHFFINVLSGAALWNGSPPGRLPQQILGSAIYQRTYGDRDFEVTLNRRGTYQTTRKFEDRFYYQFCIRPDNGRVVIRELDDTDQTTRELIEFGKGATPWFEGIPRRLKEMHSHWMSADGSSVVFRDLVFNKRNIDFFILRAGAQSACFQVPLSDRNLPFESLRSRRQSFPRFVHIADATACDVTRALAKFEDKQYIHCLKIARDGREQVMFHLPRFKLMFRSEGDNLTSVEHMGYKLAATQQLPDTLPFFSHYLVLEQITNDDFAAAPVKLLVPDGDVVINGCATSVLLPSDANAKLEYFAYDKHPRLDCFVAKSIVSRLHLAAIFAATGTRLPDRQLSMTASEKAMELVRQSWVTRVLSPAEQAKLNLLQKYAAREPGLAILCHKLEYESRQLAFLHDGAAQDVTGTGLYADWIAAAVTEYRMMGADGEEVNTLRRCLTVEETRAHLGGPPRRRFPHQVGRMHVTTELPPCPYDRSVGRQIESELEDKVFLRNKSANTTSFPLTLNDNAIRLEAEMINELKQSFDQHHIGADGGALACGGDEPQKEAGDPSFRMYRGGSCGRGPPRATTKGSQPPAFGGVADLLRVAFDRTILPQLNPYFTAKCRDELWERVIWFLELCELEDRLSRIALTLGNEAQLVLELQQKREWSTKEHPRWLVFEVEGRISIRPIQYVVARHQIENAGFITQLNMGLGKTRVILPLLILHYITEAEEASSRKKPVKPRVHVLTPLYREAMDFLHRNLTASVLGVRIEEQPFDRRVELTESRVQVLRKFAERPRGCVLVSPEHRLSLELKCQELRLQGTSHEHLAAFLSEVRFKDIFDESDALLSHKYQLIYAVGDAASLERWYERAIVAQTLLRIVNTSKTATARLFELGVAVADDSSRLYEWKGFRLCEREAIDISVLRQFRRAIVESILDDKHEGLVGISLYAKKSTAHREALIAAIINSDSSIDPPEDMEEDAEKACLHALRGLLGYGLLEFALERRNRVNYGIDRVHERDKRLAVPFRAADVPSTRSEFSHPDLGILTTVLAYYYDGISREAVTSAIQVLLSLGGPAQIAEYKRWLDPVWPGLSPDERKMIDDVAKIDQSNANQMELMVRVFSRSMECINFWLNSVILQADTQQYPKRIVATSWDLASAGDANGFSGTKDNYRLLPLQVEQNEPEVLKSTDGRMLDCIINHTLRYETLRGEEAFWKTLLNFTVESKHNALIDTGAYPRGHIQECPGRGLDARNIVQESHRARFAGYRRTELQVEEEAEEEVERQISPREPRLEKAWDYASAANKAQTVDDLRGAVHIEPLTQVMASALVPKDAAQGIWHSQAGKRIYATENFYTTVQPIDGTTSADYLRPVDLILLFRSGDVLLLSDMEADGILRRFLLHTTMKFGTTLVNLSQLRYYWDTRRSKSSIFIPRLMVGAPISPPSDESVLTVLQIINGEPMFNTDDRKNILFDMTKDKRTRDTLYVIVDAHRNKHNLPCSDLQHMCGSERWLFRERKVI